MLQVIEMTVRCWAVCCVLAVLGTCVESEVFPSPETRESETSYWMEHGERELQEALSRPQYTNKAKNVILFLGDGMGVTVNTAGRIMKGQKEGKSGEEGYLVWDRFPNVALLKTYNLDRQVPDSAGTATAFLAGVKANYYTVGVNGNVKLNDCAASLKNKNRVDTVLKWAQDAGKATGVVTTTQITHATPAALYAKSPQRYWQCDTKIMAAGPEALRCKDIARQLVEDDPARNMKVIMGGGRQEMGAREDNSAEEKCVRNDGRNLVEEWKMDKEARGATNAYASTTGQLREIDPTDTDFIMGLFGDLHMPYEVDRDTSLNGTPSIEEMTKVALQRLKQEEKGFFLLVEGGRIDHGMHYTQPKRSLEELVAMERAVLATLNQVNLTETLVLVTADHSHVMTMNGYPIRGNNIFGTVINEDDVSDHMPYTTLMFTNGPGFNYTWNGAEVIRRNLSEVDTTHKDFEPLAAVPTYSGSETHGGEDVAVFAQGPMAHLFHRVHEQSYVAHVMAYAACIGPYSKNCQYHIEDPTNYYNHVKNQRGQHREPSGASGAMANFALVVFTLLLCF
ncbi:hypothetical protein Pcinc_025993 [Petrolisthes cinctipes]|uniref:Alkaline phosphatase n=1 Tax=Petrolisthes cinctipes TaxID=88211 RepID=A0AAE1KCZ7_PETCI|nr:hypothetical protein Pcinc_025993 [Petrolisthes cinctipes]